MPDLRFHHALPTVRDRQHRAERDDSARGHLVACRADLRALIDRLIFVATDVALRRSRRVHRDQHERGRDLASIERFWARAEDTFAAWGALAEEAADLVVDGSEDVEAMTRLVVDYLSHKPDH